MSVIVRMLKQKAVYFPPQQKADDYGMPVTSDPVEIRCRWEDTVQEMVDANGRKFTSKAMVYVDRDVQIGGVLWLGTLVQAIEYGGKKTESSFPVILSGTLPKSPFQLPGASEIKKIEKYGDFRVRHFLRMAIL